ncbi:proteasome assembly chaperone family protein [Halolamina sp. CBA1230]|uniref:proteasome assembly chaperone family protein n=1 Tax=Halolamina sp. CBA1230 TaxID=1853690 RepID=UPI0009A1C76C|nr:PAC2 family protein [Halolamina sp. CBA1230]QKY19945.1 proteasome assembly chaperone family protein [Halolamina sp. CBA1230]
MNDSARPASQFAVEGTEDPKETLLCGFASYGLSGLTAVDFLIDQLELVETGHVAAEGMPSITPFENGQPTHHTRLFSRPDLELTLLKNELFVPPALSSPFGEEILSWTERHGVREIVVVDAVPMQHGPDDHRTYYVATDDYRERRLAETSIEPMARGYLDGVTGALVEQGIDSPLAVGVFRTPVHEQMPDVEAAIRLIETVNGVYDLDVDTEPLQEFADEIQRYYEELHERYEAAAERERAFDDRMYM